jgi:hypothetical protein
MKIMYFAHTYGGDVPRKFSMMRDNEKQFHQMVSNVNRNFPVQAANAHESLRDLYLKFGTNLEQAIGKEHTITIKKSNMKKDTATKALKMIERLRDETTWKAANGRELLVKEMTTDHIQNTVIMLDERVKKCKALKLGEFSMNDMKATEWIEIFRDELAYRAKYGN